MSAFKKSNDKGEWNKIDSMKPVYLESCTPQFILLIINILDSSECSYELMSVVTHFGGAGGKFSLQ